MRVHVCENAKKKKKKKKKRKRKEKEKSLADYLEKKTPVSSNHYY